jgi:hypothetical protein
MLNASIPVSIAVNAEGLREVPAFARALRRLSRHACLLDAVPGVPEGRVRRDQAACRAGGGDARLDSSANPTGKQGIECCL